MSDAYGSISFSFSDDFIGDLDAVLEVLNQYHWTNDGCVWEKVRMRNEEQVFFTLVCGRRVQYPTVFPEEDVGVSNFGEDGKLKRIENPTEEDWANADNVDFETIPLSRLAAELANGIERGWIELNAYSTEKTWYENSEQLRVNHDGTATRSREVVSEGCEENLFEEV